MFRKQYAGVFDGDDLWRKLPVPTGDRFAWDDSSTYIRKPPFLEDVSTEPAAAADRGRAVAIEVHTGVAHARRRRVAVAFTLEALGLPSFPQHRVDEPRGAVHTMF